jgi:response regulator NasT
MIKSKGNGLRVLLIDESPERAQVVEQALAHHGHEIFASALSGLDLIESVERIQPDVVIIDVDSPDRDTLEGMRVVSAERPRPIVMFTNDGNPTLIRAALQAGVSAYVVDGLSPGRVQSVVETSIARFEAFQEIRQELADAKSALDERKVIDRAKGILMQQRGLCEEEAYKLLRKSAMNRSQRIADLARSLIAAAELMS